VPSLQTEAQEAVAIDPFETQPQYLFGAGDAAIPE
jgi:hypothetical protein